MAGKPKSRWANTEEDDALAARAKAEKEERRLKKAEKARMQLEQETQRQRDGQGVGGEEEGQQPSKRRKIESSPVSIQSPAKRTLRFATNTWRQCRNVKAFEVLNNIEEGTYGWVVRAAETATGKVVALKKLKMEANDPNGLPVTGLREIQILQNCRHRNIVGLEEIVTGDDHNKLDRSIYLVLEFVEHDLKTILEDMPSPFLSSEVKQLVLQLAAGVAHLHSNWILHRDLKTSNLLLNNRGQLKIADFGMARFVGSPPPEQLTQLVVTLWYRSPELLLGTQSYDSKVDTWSIGCIFGELITREPLLQGKNEVDQITKIFELCGIPTEESWPSFRRLSNARRLTLPRTAPPPTMKARFPTITNAAASLLGALLSMDPEKRPSAAQVLEHEYFRQDPKPKPESMFPTFPSRAGQERRRRYEPNAPTRGQAVALGEIDLGGVFGGKETEERGGGFSLRMV